MVAHKNFRAVAGPLPHIVRTPAPWLRVTMHRTGYNWEVNCYKWPTGEWIGKGPAAGRLSPDAVASAALRGLSRVLRQKKPRLFKDQLQARLSALTGGTKQRPPHGSHPPCPGIDQAEPKEPLLLPHERYEVARWIRWARRIGTTILLLQSMAFVSFMWEESLQTTGFACKAAMDAKHEPTATAAVAQYASIMGKAQSWQSNVGWLGLWAHRAYYAYFYLAAPSQLQSFKARQQQLWPVDRTPAKEDTWAGAQANRPNVEAAIVGERIDPRHPQAWEARGKAALAGYDPWLKWPLGSIPGDTDQRDAGGVSTRPAEYDLSANRASRPDPKPQAAPAASQPSVPVDKVPAKPPVYTRCLGFAKSTGQQCRCSSAGHPSGRCRFHRPEGVPKCPM